MEVKFDPTIQSYFNSSRALQKRFGSLSKKLILVVENLMKTRRADMMQIPGHPHPLRKYRNREIFSITVKHLNVVKDPNSYSHYKDFVTCTYF